MSQKMTLEKIHSMAANKKNISCTPVNQMIQKMTLDKIHSTVTEEKKKEENTEI